MSWFNNAPPEEIIGKVLKDYSVNGNYDKLTLRFDDDSCCKFYHEQDCCENVQIHSDSLELEFLRLYFGKEITGFYQDEPSIKPEEIFDAERLRWLDSYTVTDLVFQFGEEKVVVRWLGESNGYYSESVNFMWR